MAVTPLAQSKTDEQKLKGIINTEKLKVVKPYSVGSLAPWSDSEYKQYYKSSPTSSTSIDSTNTGKFLGLDAAEWGLAFDIARSVLPENRAYQGEEGNLARGLDTAYNGLSDAVSMFGPVGTLAGTIMKGGAFLNLGIAALGGGTDGMTKTDAILNSNFLGLTPLGLINGLAGSRADKYSRDSLIDAETNGSYGGFLNLEDESDKVSSKKYGLFSQGAKNAANNLVLKTTALLISLGNIEDTNRTNLMAALGNTPFISNRILLDYSGGVRQALVGREGLKFAKRVISKARVKKVLDESTNKTVTIPTDLTDDLKMGREPITTSDGKTVYMTGDGNVISKIKKALEGIKLPKWIYPDDNNEGLYITDFNKLSSSNEISMLENFIKNNPAFKGYKVWKSPLHQGTYFVLTEQEANKRDLEFLNSLNISSGSTGGLPAVADYYTIIDGKKMYPLLNPTEDSTHVGEDGKYYYFPEAFKDGGKVNVIPEGALHAHKHHLEEVDEKFEDVTNKGIPVVTESKDGGLVQLAEVEKEEIIFRLDVTKKLEELKKKGTDEAAIEAGKLLVHEILHNTVDNADLIEKTN